jgi:hypothetical protein
MRSTTSWWCCSRTAPSTTCWGAYGPEDGKNFDGVIGKDLSNPIPEWAQHGAGEAFLERIFNAYRAGTSESGSNVWNTALLIGWDEPG